jgi:hypothetical protein
METVEKKRYRKRETGTSARSDQATARFIARDFLEA